MKNLVVIFGLLFSGQLMADYVLPRIDEGDYFLVYALIVGMDCTYEFQPIEPGKVDENGNITLFGDVTVLAKDRPVHEVREEILELTKQQTGHSSKNIAVRYLAVDNDESFAKLLVRFVSKLKPPCFRTLPPPGNFEPNPNREVSFGKLANLSYNKSFKRDAVNGAP